LNELPREKKNKISPKYRSGLRLLHFFSIKYILETAGDYRFKVKDKVDTPGGDRNVQGLFTYRSGKGIPNCTIFFRKIR
jgi:hypothetical protein